MNTISVKIISESRVELPTYATEGASGMDLRANLSATAVLKSLERVLIPTGIRLEIPRGYEAQIRPRSGMALKQGITCLNSPGTIDSDYRGELHVLLVNLSNATQNIEPGDRIAQLVFCPVTKAVLHPSDQLESTRRGERGFGHTGIR